MTYIFLETTDFEPHIQSRLLDANSAGNFPDIMEPLEKQNIAFISAKLGSRYDMVAVFAEETPKDRNQVILKILILLCLYDLIRRNAARKVPSDFREDYNWAMKELDKLQSGKAYAGLPPAKDENGDIIYAGPTFDDPRTTDNAWIETIVVHYHITEDLAKKIKLKHQPGETKKVEWIDCEGNLYGGHSHFLKLVKNKMNNKIVVNTIPINFEQFREVGSVFIYLIFVIFIMYQLLCVGKAIRLTEHIDKCIEFDLFLEYSTLNCTM